MSLAKTANNLSLTANYGGEAVFFHNSFFISLFLFIFAPS